MLAILRRKGLGNGSTKAIKNFLSESGVNIDILRRHRERFQKLEGSRWIPMPMMEYDLVLRWGFSGDFHYPDNKTINLSEHIHLVNDKPECRRKLIEANISCPRTFFSKREMNTYLPDEDIGELPEGISAVIGRPRHHAQGKNIKVCRSTIDVGNDNTSAYWSEIIDKDREYRVYTFFGRIIMVAEKVPTAIGRERLAWNHFGGGAVFKNVKWSNWPIECCKEALKASNVIGIDFAGVDVMEKDGKPYILEINSAHSLTSEYRQKTFAKALKWVIENNKPEHFEFPERIRTYKSMILPCLR